MVRAAEAGGFNTLLVQVRARGDAYFDSSLEPRAAELASRPGFDPLAHDDRAGARGWIEGSRVGVGESRVERRTSFRRHVNTSSIARPEWLMVPRELAAEMRALPVRSPAYVGRLARWTRAHSERGRGSLCVAGESRGGDSHGSRHRRHGAEVPARRRAPRLRALSRTTAFDYGPAALDQFKLEILSTVSAPERSAAAARERLDPLAYPNLFPNRWEAFRRSRLTSLIMRVRTAVKAARPGIVVSAAVVPDAQQAFERRLQDWRTWLDESLIDVLCPMAYTSDASVFQQQVAAAKAYAGDRPVWAGIGAYRLSSAQTLEHIAAAQRLGTAGIILFSYDALIAPPNNIGSLSALGRAAFGAGSQ